MQKTENATHKIVSIPCKRIISNAMECYSFLYLTNSQFRLEVTDDRVPTGSRRITRRGTTEATCQRKVTRCPASGGLFVAWRYLQICHYAKQLCRLFILIIIKLLCKLRVYVIKVVKLDVFHFYRAPLGYNNSFTLPPKNSTKVLNGIYTTRH